MPRQRKLPSGMIKRGDVYHADFRAGGGRVRGRLSTDYRAACEILNDLRARADKSDFNLVDNDYPLADLKAEYLRWRRQTSRTGDEAASDLGQFEKYCPIRSVRQITHEYVVGFRDHRMGTGVCARTVNKQVNTLRSMLNKGVEWGRLGSNPIKDIKPLPHDKLCKERRSLTEAEAIAIWNASPANRQPVWRTFLCTGIRLSELVSLTFDDFDAEARTITVRAEVAKNGRERSIPLDDQTYDTISKLRDEAKARRTVDGWTARLSERQRANFSKDHIFVTTANTPWRNNLLTRFYADCKRAGIVDAVPGGAIDIHSLRVSFTTLSLEGGASPKAVQSLLGHSTLELTMQVYAKAGERAKRDAIGALPFATMTTPDHVVSMQNVHTVSTSLPKRSKRATQPKAEVVFA